MNIQSFYLGHGFPKTEARILGFSNVGVLNTELVLEMISELALELVLEFTGDQTEMIKETVVEAIASLSHSNLFKHISNSSYYFTLISTID